MVETKSVKVDNWGVFFLQKLQNFFNKTDYCDLTLQFMDNSQLKVHRLVLSACTDYFNVLEQQTDCMTDILNMPYDLQADVVVPIVNFMYTGTLEFEVNMYGRLLKTAKDMNMTVLLKLLEAHKRTVDVQPTQRAPPVLLNKGAGTGQQYHRTGSGGNAVASTSAYGRSNVAHGGAAQRYSPGAAVARKPPVAASQQQQQQQQQQRTKGTATTSEARLGVRPVGGSAGVPVIRRGVPPSTDTVRLMAKASTPGSRATASNRGPSRFDADAASGLNTTGGSSELESSFDNLSYESKPLLTARQMIKDDQLDNSNDSSGGFEQLRRGYTGVKRPASALVGAGTTGESPPEKKPNIEEVKEYIEADRMRKKIMEEFNEDEDDEEDDEDGGGGGGADRRRSAGSGGDDSMDHQRIISEVLKKYPHLVKSNKNIQLKITQKGKQQTITAPLRSSGAIGSTKVAGGAPLARSPAASTSRPVVGAKPPVAGSPPVATVASGKPLVVVHTPAAPKKIDSKTMHALIAKGAENTTGPWLCLKCGVNGRPISIPSYKGFRRHLINVHKLKIDPKLCEHCGWRSAHKTELHHHWLVVHNITPPADMRFPKCSECVYVAVDERDLRNHQIETHPSKTTGKATPAAPTPSTSTAAQQHCIYCNKTFADETRLYEHIKTQHKERACEDGLMEEDETAATTSAPSQRRHDDEDDDDDDEEDMDDDDEEYVPPKTVAQPISEKRKINVLSSITLPSKAKLVVPSSATSAAVDAAASKPSARRSGTLDPVTGTFGDGDGDDDDEEDTAMEQGDQADAKQTAVTPTAAVISQEEAESNAYLEFVMAEVHGEKKPTADELTTTTAASAAPHTDELPTTSAADAAAVEQLNNTQFVTEDGAAVELTEEQKKDLIDQLHDQSGVVIMLKDGDLSLEDVSAADDADTARAEQTATAGGSADASTAANNRSLDELQESLEWDLGSATVSSKGTDRDATAAVTATSGQQQEKSNAAADKANELIGEWSADDTEDGDSVHDDSATSKPDVPTTAAAAAAEEDASAPTEVKAAQAQQQASETATSDFFLGLEAELAKQTTADEADAPDSGIATVTQQSTSGDSVAAARRSYSRDSNKEPDAKDASGSASAKRPALDDDDESSIDEPKRDAETMKKDSNIEIKTLISNDWGDDDEDDTMDK